MDNIYSPKKTVFIDESGNNGFEFSAENVSTHYILVAIIINTDILTQVRSNAETIRMKYAQKGELKSSNCKNTGKRFNILKDISNLEITINALIVDKRKIYDGSPIIEFSNSVFYKFMNKHLYKELNSLDCDIAIHADEYKDEEFLNSFKKYLKKNKLLQRTLIDNNSLQFTNSKSDVLIQISDFIAGSLAFGFEEGKDKKAFNGYYSLLKDKLIIKHWPNTNLIDDLKFIPDEKYDKKVADTCIKLVSDYIASNESSSNERHIDQIYTLRYLQREIVINGGSEYIYSDSIMRHIFSITGRNYKKPQFLSDIIAPIRDSGVIISASNIGYKIPLTYNDLFEYSEHTLDIVLPQIERLKMARNKILNVTDKKLDILGSGKYDKIKEYMSL